MKGDLAKDGKMSSYEKARSNAIQKAMAKKKLGKVKCSSCGGKGCPKCKGTGMAKGKQNVQNKRLKRNGTSC